MHRLIASTVLLAAALLLAACGEDFTGPTKADATLLTSGTPVTNLSGERHDKKYYRIAVPAGAGQLAVTTTGGTGDVDLLLHFRDIPPVNGAHCGSVNVGSNDENCTFTTTPAGDYYIMLYGFESYSGVTLTATISMAP